MQRFVIFLMIGITPLFGQTTTPTVAGAAAVEAKESSSEWKSWTAIGVVLVTTIAGVTAVALYDGKASH